MTPFDLKIITPEKTFFEGNTEQIIVRTVSGDIGILAGHAHMWQISFLLLSVSK